ncbi:uncharacterized protein LOC128200503 [Galleria mellonella]|uniref:Uncharacterized protein LOC128200503 n=1 Tax=Galleria mellonella TaxID=7137 RepID=A0ABM3MF89_GALME|nr:uncharacterized protein LOC128200503 [Galleria mellonella]
MILARSPVRRPVNLPSASAEARKADSAAPQASPPSSGTSSTDFHPTWRPIAESDSSSRSCHGSALDENSVFTSLPLPQRTQSNVAAEGADCSERVQTLALGIVSTLRQAKSVTADMRNRAIDSANQIAWLAGNSMARRLKEIETESAACKQELMTVRSELGEIKALIASNKAVNIGEGGQIDLNSAFTASALDPLMKEIRTLREELTKREDVCSTKHVTREQLDKILGDKIEAIKADISTAKTAILDMREARHEEVISLMHEQGTALDAEVALNEIKEQIKEVRTKVQENAKAISNRAELQNAKKPTIPSTANSVPVSESKPANQANKNKPRRPSSYAEALSKPNYAVLIESADPRKTSEDVINHVKQNVNVIDLGIGVNRVTKIKNQKVIMACGSQEERSALQEAIRQKCTQISARSTRDRLPQIRLVGVINSLTDAEIEKAVTSQNRHLLGSLPPNSQVKVLRRTKGRTQEVKNAILEVSPSIWKAAQGQKLHIGLQLVPAVDQSPLIQCYKCMGYNHRAAECNEKIRCGHCAQEHDTRACPNRNLTPQCCNCKKAKRDLEPHPAYSQDCPDWQKWDGIARAAETLKIAQINLGRGHSATQECLREATQQGYSVLLLQEPYVGSKGYLSVGGNSRIIQKLHNRSHPVRAAIVILNPSLRIIESQEWITEDIVGLKITVGNDTFILINAYLDKTHDIEQTVNSLRKIVDSTGTTNLLLAGDANAKSPWWGCDSEDERGSKIMDMFAELGMEVLNQGSQPTFLVYRQGQPCQSIIDITACSSQVLNLITDWKVNPNLCSLSDHIPITFNLKATPNLDTYPSSTRVFFTAKADWTKFEETFTNNLEQLNISTEAILDIDNTTDLEHIVLKYQDALTNACNESMPKIQNKKCIKSAKWWTTNLSKLKAELKRNRNRIKKANPNARNFVVQEYLKKKEEYKKEIQLAITKSWKEFCTGEERETVWQRSYRIIKHSSKAVREKLLIGNDGTTLSADESAALLANTFFPEDDPTKDNHEHSQIRQKSIEITSKNLPMDRQITLFTEQELQSALQHANSKKAPGVDAFTADICQKAFKTCPEILLAIYNRCLLLSYFPEVWKEAYIKVIPKPGKDDYSLPKSYRPIGLLSLLGKTLEKMMARRLQWDLTARGSLHPNQYGFLPQKSTEDALYDALSIVKSAIKSKQLAVIVSLDIQGAFDSAWWPTIITQLDTMGIDEDILQLITSYLSQRKITIKYSGVTINRETNRGCIQGSVCGPILWNVQLNQALEASQYGGVHIQAFADDIILIAQGSTGEEVERNLNQALAKILNWGNKLKLKFAPHKTQAVLFTKKLKYHTPRLVMDGTPIEIRDEVKVLGLIIDRNLNFNSHIRTVSAKALNIYKSVSKMARAQWGLNPSVLKLIYQSVVEPTILYAASCWAHTTSNHYVGKTLDRITRLFAIKICKGHRTTSFSASVVLAGILPLKLKAIEQAELYLIKRGEPLDELPGREFESRTPVSSLPHPTNRKAISFKIINNQSELDDVIDNNWPRFFTDGSKIEGKVGGSVTCWLENKEVYFTSFRLEDFCSVFQAELAAILKAIEVMGKKPKLQVANILSDSRSALESIADPCPLHPLTMKIRQKLQDIVQKGGKVQFYWVKAHVGIHGNERADDLAKTAALKKKIKPVYDRFPLTYAKKLLREKSLDKCQKLYTESNTAAITKMFLPDIRKAYKIVKEIDIDNTITHLLTGHGGNRSYLHRFKLIDSPSCQCDSETPQTIQHILFDCQRFAKKRFECEFKLDATLSESNMEYIFENKDTRDILLNFAKPLLRSTGIPNGVGPHRLAGPDSVWGGYEMLNTHPHLGEARGDARATSQGHVGMGWDCPRSRHPGPVAM